MGTIGSDMGWLLHMQADKETLQELQRDSDAMQERLQQLGQSQPEKNAV